MVRPDVLDHGHEAAVGTPYLGEDMSDLKIYVVAIPCIAYPHVIAASREQAIEIARENIRATGPDNPALYDPRWGRVSEEPWVIEERDEG
jgi:hypothetical protein